MDLFEYARELNKDKESPLAGRMRPATLDEVVGQEHIIGKDKLLYRAIKADKISENQPNLENPRSVFIVICGT